METASVLRHRELVDELSKGMKNTILLRQRLSLMCHPSEAEDWLMQCIISSFEKGLMILSAGGSTSQARRRCGSVAADFPATAYQGGHCRSVREGETSKKRKLHLKWCVESANRLEGQGPSEDGYSWRKYGQKDILGAKYPRSYYRCRHRHAQSCWATKQVQRSDDDPNVFDITYKGTHSCNEVVQNSALPQETSTELEPSSNKNKEVQHNDLLQSLKDELEVDTQCLNMEDMASNYLFTEFGSMEWEKENHHYSPKPAFVGDSGSCPTTPALVDNSGMSSYSSPLFHSPATSSANRNNEAAYEMRDYEEALLYLEAQAPETASAHASTTISPSGGSEFPTDEEALDTDFHE